MVANTYPHLIDNGHGETIHFLRVAPSARGGRLEVENLVKPGVGPPMHAHLMQEEALTVVEGRIGYQSLGGEPKFAGPGATVVFQPGEAHKFWNAGETDLKCVGYAEPP